LLQILGDKKGVFLKKQCYDSVFAQFSSVFSPNPPIFSAKDILKISSSVPGMTLI
jgi:hypothetical protein